MAVEAVRIVRCACPDEQDGEASAAGESARAALAALAQQQMDRLRALADETWDRYDAPDRAEAADRALFDGSPTAMRLMRYEVSPDLMFHRCLNALFRIRREAARDRDPADRPAWRPEPAWTSPKMGEYL